MEVYQDVKKIFGPYKSKYDFRLRVILQKYDGSKVTISYPKFLVEKAIGCYLIKKRNC